MSTSAERFKAALGKYDSGDEGRAEALEVIGSFLQRYGYFESEAPTSPVTEASLAPAVQKYKAFRGLGQDGELDRPTLAAMAKPRCGFRDPGGFAEAASLPCRWGEPSSLKVSIGAFPANRPNVLEDAEVRAAVESAFNEWAAVSDGLIGFQFDFDADQSPDILIEWVLRADIGAAIGDAVAEAELPPGCSSNGSQALPRRIFMDDSKQWIVGDSELSCDIRTVVIHEVGHILGFGHVGVEVASVMHSELDFIAGGLFQGDIDRLLARYIAVPPAGPPALGLSPQL